MSISRMLYISIFIVNLFFLAACTDETTVILPGDTPVSGGDLDTDNDGLTDLDELNVYGTNPNLLDTDADGFSDYDEVVTLGFDPDGNRLRFNPLIADTPKIAITLLSAPEVQINYSETNGSATSISTSRSQSSSSSFTRSDSSEMTNGFERSYTAGIEASVTAAYPPSASATVSFEATQTFSQDNTTSWSEEQTNENSNALEQAEAFETSNEVSAGDGQVAIVASIVNSGNLSYTVESLILSSTYYDVSLSRPVLPVGNMDFDTVAGAFPSVTLGPDQATGPLNFIAKNINLQTVKRLLGNSKGLTVKPSIFNLLDADGNAYNFNLAGIQAQNAMLIIDFGTSSGRSPINEWIAVNGNPATKISIQDALTSVLGLGVSTSAVPGVISGVDGINNMPINAADPFGDKGVWVLVHASNTGTNQYSTTVYTTPEQQTRLLSLNPQISNLVTSYDLTTISLRGGDFLSLSYIQDSDLDGVGDRDEFFYRTDVLLSDTDGDGLTDGQEIAGWDVTYTKGIIDTTISVSSNPLRMDTDGDGMNDYDEANLVAADPTLSRNPLSADTDGDGIPDLDDDFTLLMPATRLANVFDATDISNLSATFNSDPPANIDLRYELSDVMGTGDFSITGNNVSSYKVLLLRFNNELNHPNIPEPNPVDNANYLPGTKLVCDPALLGTPSTGPASSTCDWLVVDFYDAVADGPTLFPAIRELPGTSVIDGTNGSSDLGTGPFKYIAYVQINGDYRRSDELAFASGDSEIIRIRMMGGQLLENRTRGGADNTFDAYWSLIVDGKVLEDGLVPGSNPPVSLIRQVAFSNVTRSNIQTTASGYGWDIFANTDPLLKNPAVGTTSDIYTGGGWNFLDTTINIQHELTNQTQNGVPVYEFRVPATEGCHEIRVEVAELNVNLGWQFVSFPSPGGDLFRAVDTAKLCRDSAAPGLGIWTIESRFPNNDPKAVDNRIIGSAPSPSLDITSSTGFEGRTITQTNNIFPIEYQTRPLLWNWFTPTATTGLNPNNQSGDIRVRYDVRIISAP